MTGQQFMETFHKCTTHHIDRSTGWRASFQVSSLSEPFQCSSVLFTFFLTVHLVLASSGQKRLVQCWGKGSLVELISFSNFLKALNCLLTDLNDLPCKIEYFTLLQSILLIYPPCPLNVFCIKGLSSKIEGYNVRRNSEAINTSLSHIILKIELFLFQK